MEKLKFFFKEEENNIANKKNKVWLSSTFIDDWQHRKVPEGKI